MRPEGLKIQFLYFHVKNKETILNAEKFQKTKQFLRSPQNIFTTGPSKTSSQLCYVSLAIIHKK